MLELRNAETGEIIDDPAVGHGPMYDPLGHFVSYVIAVDRFAMLVPTLKFILVDTATDTAAAIGSIERNPSLPEEQRIWRLMPPVSLVPDPAPALSPARSAIGVLGFLLARDLDQAKSVMEAKGFPLVKGYESVWRDPDGVALLFVRNHIEMRGRTVAVVYTTDDFDLHPQASEMLAMAERCLQVTNGRVKVL